uniref:Thioredoxin domain-containing protein n=1 Tax=Hemiselmis tepida TaxID=464990 RepID=A0A7S0YJ62_9CRYP
MVNLGIIVPDFEAATTEGPIKFHEYIEGSWTVLLSHPADYTPVCTTELGYMNKILPEFKKRGCKVLALSCDDVESHKGWITDIEKTQNCGTFSYPIIADPSRELAVQWGMVDPEEKDSKGLPMTCRAVFLIGPDKKLKLSILYPASTGRNFDEIVRVLDALQLTANHSVATPVNWKPGGDCMVVPTLTDAEATEKFVKGFKTVETPSGKPYLRITPQPDR